MCKLRSSRTHHVSPDKATRILAIIGIALLGFTGTMLADWSVSIFQQPPTNTEVGDYLTGTVTIVNDPGADDLTVNSISTDAVSVGVDMFNQASGVPFSLAAGTSKDLMFTFRLIGAPGSTSNKVVVKVSARLGAAAPENKTATTRTITSKESVTATLTTGDDSAPSFSGDAATVTPLNQIQYTLVLINASDTPAQLNGLPAGLIAPAGTTPVSPATGSATVAANGTSTWSLVVDVNDNLTNGTALAETPTGINYAMSAISLPTRPVLTITPSNFTSVVRFPLLAIQKLSSASVRLRWPTNDTGFTLQSNTNLTTTNWTTVSPSPSVLGTNNVVTNTTSGAQKFYRLKQ